MGWNYLSIPKLQRLHRWSLGMDKQFRPILYWVCNYISMLGLKLNHVIKSGPMRQTSITKPIRYLWTIHENDPRNVVDTRVLMGIFTARNWKMRKINSSKIAFAIKDVKKKYKKWKMSPHDCPDYLILGHNLKLYNKYLNQCIRTAKQEFYMREFTKYKNGIRKFGTH